MSTETTKRMPPYKDIADIPEDDRIKMIGGLVMREKKIVGFFTDDEEGKADRYISKLKERFPGIRIVSRGPGFISGSVYVEVGPRHWYEESR